SIHRIDDGVVSRLQSQVTINSIDSVIKEFIENSIDADATQVVIDFQLDNFYKVTCRDNGRGLSPEELNEIGKRYYSSKLSKFEDLKKISTFGFRGEALHSIISLSSIVSIVSKVQEYNSGYCVIFSNGKRLSESRFADENDVGLIGSIGKTGSKTGTMISVSNLFGNVPVRKIAMDKISDLKIINDIRKAVFQISIVHPEVRIKVSKIMKNEHGGDSISLITSTGGETNFNNYDSGKISALILKSVYGISMLENFETFQAEFENYKLNGVIGLIPVQTKNFQSIFINKNPLVNTDFFKEINKLFHSTDFIFKKEGKSPIKIVGKPFNKYPIFIFTIKCPNAISDLIQDPSKCIHETKHLKIIKIMILRVLKRFFKIHGYNVNIEKTLNQDISSTKNSLTKILQQEVESQTESSDSLKRPSVELALNSKNGNKKIPSIISKLYSNSSSLDIEKHGDSHNCNHEIPQLDIENLQKRSAFFPDITKIKLSSSNLQNCEVIRQIDKKFILIKLNDVTDVEETGKSSILVIMDQHASDERIKVEKYLKEFIESTILDSNLTEEKIADFRLSQDIKFKVSYNEQEMFNKYKADFQKWRIFYELDDQNNEIKVTHLPTILSKKIDFNVDFLKNVLHQHCCDLMTNFKQRNIGPNPSSLEDRWWFMLRCIPRVLVDLINSKACRSAIMFGDELPLQNCKELVSNLSKCKLPFQCAHGRPSIAPLVDLNNCIA
ncbi:hypothetical protein PACTADRAFT_20237, partial [Pachysolen tannophilus NRRL Y-2460]